MLDRGNIDNSMIVSSIRAVEFRRIENQFYLERNFNEKL